MKPRAQPLGYMDVMDIFIRRPAYSRNMYSVHLGNAERLLRIVMKATHTDSEYCTFGMGVAYRVKAYRAHPNSLNKRHQPMMKSQTDRLFTAIRSDIFFACNKAT